MSDTGGTMRDTGGAQALSAIFDTRADAEAAAERLVAAGVPRDGVRLIPETAEHQAEGEDVGSQGGFLGALVTMFLPRDEHGAYAEAIRRGGTLVVADNVPAGLHDAAMDALDQTGAFDLDERAEQWRAEGWAELGPEGGEPPERAGRRVPVAGRRSVRSYTVG